MVSTRIPEKMQAVEISQPGGPDVLNLIEQSVPAPSEMQLLIKVTSAGVNRPDILQRMGHYPPPKGASEIPGLEVAGEVVLTGSEVSHFQPGDKVCALVSGGGYAQYCLADEGTTLRVPEKIDLIDSAGIPETAFTVWSNIFDRGRLKNNEWLLVHGGASGIGTMAIQLATAFGARVITTVGSDKKKNFCETIGAVRAINYLKEDYVQIVKDITQGHGADVILDMIGGDYIQRNVKVAAEDGRIVQIAFLNGAIAEVNFMRLMLKRLTLTGSTLRARPLQVKAQIARDVEKHIWPLIENDEVRVIVDSKFPLEQAQQAHMRMESREHVGKIILTTT